MPMLKVSRVNMEDYLTKRRYWLWFRIERSRSRYRSIRSDKVIDYMTRSSGDEYCVMPKRGEHQLIQAAARALEVHLQKLGKRVSEAVQTHQRKRDLQKRKRYGIVRGRSEGNPIEMERGSPATVALISPTRPRPSAQDETALPGSVEWLTSHSRQWFVRSKGFDKWYSLKDCEREQQNPDKALEGSQLCLFNIHCIQENISRP